jgi:hypothetical protein
MFIGNNRIPDATLCLKYDRFLIPKFERTIIHHCTPQADIRSAFNRYNIDMSRIEFVHDSELVEQFNRESLVDTITWLSDPNIAWIKQQFLKFMALDVCQDTQVVISDCDSIRIRPHEYFVNGLPVLYLDNEYTENPGCWGSSFQDLTGIEQHPNNVFVSEFFPILKTDWQALKTLIESRSGLPWMVALRKQLVSRSQTEHGGLNFSEYQFLGNWVMHLRPDTQTVKQQRFWPNLHNSLESELDSINIHRLNCLNVDSKSWNVPISIDNIDYYAKVIDQRIQNI